MIKKFVNIFFFTSFFTFSFLVVKHYFSEKNIVFTNKSRSAYTIKANEEKNNLPLLKNDTDNIIVYKNGLEKFKNKKKRPWEKVISNLNE